MRGLRWAYEYVRNLLNYILWLIGDQSFDLHIKALLRAAVRIRQLQGRLTSEMSGFQQQISVGCCTGFVVVPKNNPTTRQPACVPLLAASRGNLWK